MKILAAMMLAMGFAAPAAAQAEPMRDSFGSASPALQKFAEDRLLGEVWKRPGLSPRDRSVVTVSILIARGHAIEMPFHFALALDNGVTPPELSEIITHLAFYAGWGEAHEAAAVAVRVFAARGIGAEQLPPATPELLAIDQVVEADRAARVKQAVAAVAPQLERDTTNVLFRDLWLRPGLKPRDRSLVTVSALIAAGHSAQIPSHLSRAMDAGLARAEAAEILSHAAYYAGWPNAMSAVPIFKSVFDGRPD